MNVRDAMRVYGSRPQVIMGKRLKPLVCLRLSRSVLLRAEFRVEGRHTMGNGTLVIIAQNIRYLPSTFNTGSVPLCAGLGMPDLDRLARHD